MQIKYKEALLVAGKNVNLMNEFAVKIQQPGAMKNSQGFKFTALADFLMTYVQDIHSFPDSKIKPYKVALLCVKYSLEEILLADFS